MRFHRAVSEPHIYAVVVEEYDAVTSPVSQHRINQTECETLIAPGVHKEQRWYQAHRSKHRYNFRAYFFVAYLRPISKDFNSREGIDCLFQRPRVVSVCVVKN